METMTEQKIRTLRVPVIATEFKEVNIALPYFCKKQEFRTVEYFKISEDKVVKIYDYAQPHLIVYAADSQYAPKDDEIIGMDISTEAEFEDAFDRYRYFIATL